MDNALKHRAAEALAPRTAAGANAQPTGSFVTVDGDTYYRIAAYDRMRPFFMSLATDTDLWMFVASGGGLTCGRVDAGGALFPYDTVDRLHDAHHHTGPITLLRLTDDDGRAVLWQPFEERHDLDDIRERNLYKSAGGDRLVFEEIHPGLGLAVRATWAGCDEFGWVRTVTVENLRADRRAVEVLDGLRNVLPFGADLGLYQQASTLVDAYKRTEADPRTGLAVFALSSGITDKPEAAESLRANTVWCSGLAGFDIHLSGDAVSVFRRGDRPVPQCDQRGGRGNYLVTATLDLAGGASTTWRLLADAGRDQVQVAHLRARLLAGADDHEAEIDGALRRAGDNLRRYVASADGVQVGADVTATVHHHANVLFNCMRGGVFADNHTVGAGDFAAFLRVHDTAVAGRRAAEVAALPETLPVGELVARAAATGDADFERLALELLPLHFSRRHGDPSRPWNRFAIRVRDHVGGKVLRYEGNWRDIFQNWEALCVSFPGFLPSVVAKFVNASTVDGFNPYRVTSEGIDWETDDPDDPWSNIGYWGDHQVIYLLKLLEAWRDRDPEALDTTLTRSVFAYADVPYRLRPYADMVRDPHDTIVYDHDLEARIAARVQARGADGKLVPGPDGGVRHVTLLEKLLVPALSKLSNMVPGGGIWMNTQRPEWNDANNALAGDGASVVTLCYLRRYLAFVADLLEARADETVPVSAHVATWLQRVAEILSATANRAEAVADAAGGRDAAVVRRCLMDELGAAFEEYRTRAYAEGPGRPQDLTVREALDLCHAALAHVDAGIRANRREDGLYHAYNVIDLSSDPDAVTLHRLPEMLEGQVAALSSGLIDADEAVGLLGAMYAGPLYRADQRSFLLYPERDLPGFMDRGVAPAAAVEAIGLLRRMLEEGDTSVIARDIEGRHRFHADFRNARDLAAALDAAATRDADWAALVAGDRAAVLALYESVFHHRAFTGRSGAMYGYEGLGCIYWHQVAKLLLAVQEILVRACDAGDPRPVCGSLRSLYYRVRAGLGFEKSPAEYGAFPTDPYSHTPPDGGARQPGMTGQVKEEILTRLGELGVRVREGCVEFQPTLLRRGELLGEDAALEGWAVDGAAYAHTLRAGSLGFTYCQVPVVYEEAVGAGSIRVEMTDGTETVIDGRRLDRATSRELFARSGRVAAVRVAVDGGALLGP
jgi:hypothetical protein